MKNTTIAAGILAASLLASACATSSTEYSLNELPTSVRMTVNDQIEGGMIESIERESEEGLTYYRVEYELDGNEWMLRVDDYGEVIAKKEA